MQVLQGGKDNPEFEGQKFTRDLKGELIPERKRTKEIPEHMPENRKEIIKRIDDLIQFFDDNHMVFILTFSETPEHKGENVFGGTLVGGTRDDLNYLINQAINGLQQVKR